MYLPTTKGKLMFKRYIKISISLFIFSISLFFLMFSSKVVKNTSGVEPTEPLVDYQSFRPNPKDPAFSELKDLSLLCGNNMIINKKFEVTPDEGTCSQSGDTLTCKYLIEENVRVAVDTTKSRLPIMGNTQLVYNSENKVGVSNTEELDDTEKVNNLVSWYLNGAVNYAENPHPISDFGSLVDQWWTGYYANVINFSGPLRKLLPQDVQYQNKVEQIKNATGSNSGKEKERYNQVVGCTYGIDTPITLLQNVINVLLETLGIKAIDLPGARIGNVIGPCHLDFPLADWFKKEYRLSYFIGNLPPTLAKYPEPRRWWIEYERWRGKSCFVVPGWKFIPDFLKYQGICFENPLKPNSYADLFMNIPMSSTEDRVGQLTINQPVPSSPDNVKTEILEFKLEQAATLYFPHMQESVGLAEDLQTTYKPQEGTDDSLGYTEPVEINENCQILQVRTNEEPDDFLWGDEALAKFKYKSEFECTFKQSSEQVCTGTNFANQIYSPYCYSTNTYIPEKCEKNVYFNSKIDTYTPLADEVWSRLVAGNSAVARRMFPKTGTDMFGTFIDIPTVTTAEYKVKMGDVSVSPTIAELYFPHIGGVSEYFLKGIQTLLRPKGYGENITFGEPLDYEPGDCSFDMSKIDTAIQSAASKYSVPASMLKAVFEIEALPYIANPSSYKCEENGFGAAGVMGITKSAYDIVTCDNERIDNDIPICGKTDGKFSRCNIDDTFELAARILLWKAGKWQYGPGRCAATGGISASNKMEVYNAAWKYYGSYLPDVLTKQYSYNLPGAKRPDPPGMNYADIVCNKMGLCPPYPVQ